jgi:hypothetical protein
MSTLSNCLKGLAAVALIAASPVLVIFAVPFGCGMASDVLNAAGTPAALAFTTGICLAVLAWTRHRSHAAHPAIPARRLAKSLDSISAGAQPVVIGPRT